MSTSLEGSTGSLETSLFQGLSAGNIRRVTLVPGDSSELFASGVVDDLQLGARKVIAIISKRSRNQNSKNDTG